MGKSLSRLLYLLSLLCGMVGGLLLVSGYAHGVTLLPGTVVSPYFVTMMLGLALGSLALMLGLVAWVGALSQMAVLRRWGWFTLLLVFPPGAMLIYIFSGPRYPLYPPRPLVIPPYTGFGD